MQFSDNEEIFTEWRKLIVSTDFTLGRYVEKFEKEFSNYINAKHCIATNNGTDALILALKAMGIGLGDEVITVCNSFYATTGSIVAVGATARHKLFRMPPATNFLSSSHCKGFVNPSFAKSSKL